MKKIILATGMLLSLTAFADIEYSSMEPAKATSQEISKSRACFNELEEQGCGDPGDDLQQFRSCMNNVYSTLTADCKKLMSELYGAK